MKREYLLSFFSVVFVFAAVVPAFAVSAATETRKHIPSIMVRFVCKIVTITATPVANTTKLPSQTTAGTKTTDY